jgi:L,D-transpeptidase YcbB
VRYAGEAARTGIHVSLIGDQSFLAKADRRLKQDSEMPVAIFLKLLLRRGAIGTPVFTIVFAALSLAAIAAETPANRLKAAFSSGPRMLIRADRLLDSGALSRFYALRQFQPAWSGGAVNQQRADAMVSRLEHADEEGLEPADYRASELPGLRARVDAIEFDLILTDALIRYARDLRTGRSAIGFVDRDVALPPSGFDAVQAVAALLQEKDFDIALTALEPPHKEYTQLKRALARYKEILAVGGWQAIPDIRKVPLDGDDERLALLRKRLTIEDPAISPTPPPATPGDLQAAIIRFQARNGLEPDGRIGAQTLAALKVPVTDRIDQIVANMERWRWIGAFEPSYIAVNIPEALLTVHQAEQIVLTSKVIVGKPKTPTPIFRALVAGVTANPPWNVPTTIARREILPKQRRDPDYLAKHHMVFVSFGGIRQLPGADNALGTLKLEMPNQFDTYLHDTPTKALFARYARYFSHGCMRVELIMPLASIALTGDNTSAVTKLQQAISTGTTQHLAVEKKLPVYVLYWTVVTTEDDNVTFLQDIYGRDRRLIAALHGLQPKRLAALNGASCEVSHG